MLDRDVKWRDEWLKPVPLKRSEIVSYPIDEKRIDRIKEKSYRQHGIWEVDFFYAPMLVREKEGRPYFPHLFLWVDQDSYYVLDHLLATPTEYCSELSEKFLNVIDKNKLLPMEAWVIKEEVYQSIEPIASHLGFQIKCVNKLKAVDEAHKGMTEYFKKK